MTAFRPLVTGIREDDRDGKLETKLAVIAADIIVAGEAAFRQSLIEAVEREEQWPKWQEERRQQRITELEAQRLKDLKTSGMLLAQAEEIRTLVTRMKSAVVVGATHILAEDLEPWERWALDYADRLDPILSGQVLSHIHVPELD